MEALLPLRPALRKSLQAAAHWFHGMSDSASLRLHYSYSPAHARHEDRSCPIRDIGTAADLAVLSAATNSHEFDPVIASTLQHYQSILVRHTGEAETWSHLAGGRSGLGEPSTVAHSAMMMLALTAWEGHPQEAQRRQLIAELAAGIRHQQRSDGTFAIHFGEHGGLRASTAADMGWQLYGGEAAFALSSAYSRLQDSRLLRSAAAALRAFQAKYREGEVDPDELVFFANWQCCAGAMLHRHTPDARERSWLAAYLHELQGAIIIAGRFYQGVKQAPHQQAVVEVACALEGLAHCLQASAADAAAAAAAAATGDEEARGAAGEEQRRLEVYAACARIAVAFLLEAQVSEGPGVPPAAVGGFPHSLRAGAGQRVDVTGHVCCAFVELLELLDQQEGQGQAGLQGSHGSSEE